MHWLNKKTTWHLSSVLSRWACLFLFFTATVTSGLPTSYSLRSVRIYETETPVEEEHTAKQQTQVALALRLETRRVGPEKLRLNGPIGAKTTARTVSARWPGKLGHRLNNQLCAPLRC